MKRKSYGWIALMIAPLVGLSIGAVYSYNHFQAIGSGEGKALSIIALGPYYLQCLLVGGLVGIGVGGLMFSIARKGGSE